MPVTWVLVALAAAPSASERPIEVAVPTFTAVNVSGELASFYSEHFAAELTRHGLRVTTARQIAAVISLERQRELLGCSEQSESCVAELANALGAEALALGDVAKLGETYRINLKIVDARSSRPLSLFSGSASSEDSLVAELTRAAASMAGQTYAALGRTPPARTGGGRVWAALPAGIGVAALGTAAVFAWRVEGARSTLRSDDTLTPTDARRIAVGAVQDRNVALVATGAGVVAAGVAAVLFFRSDDAPGLQAHVVPSSRGVGLAIAGALP